MIAAGARLVGQRSGRELLQVLDRLEHDTVRIAVLRGQIEQHGFDTGVDQMRGDLRAHDAGTEHGGLADAEGVDGIGAPDG